jgi:hypothetical protein
MKKIIFLNVFTFLFAFGIYAQTYNELFGSDAQHGDIAIGDVDNDGDLDIFIAGEERNDPHSQKGGLYINDGTGNFTRMDCPILPGYRAAIDFGDIDGDGDLDILFSGHKNGGIPEANARGLALNDGYGNFTIADPAQYPGFERLSPSVCFADFNNDGLLDYLIASPDEQSHYDWETGIQTSYLGVWSIFYQQADGTFIEDSSVFQNYFRDQVVSVADFDNDGDIDVFLQGYYPHLTGGEPFGLTYARWITEIFVNDGAGQFTLLEGTGFPESGLGSHDWADIDGNGFLDVIFIGDGHFGETPWEGNQYHRIFTNTAMAFEEVYTSPRAGQFSYQGANALQDLDNDGDADVLFGGWNSTIGRQKTSVLVNTDADRHIDYGDLEENTFLSDEYLPGFSEQDFELADVNGDFIVDYIYMGFRGNNPLIPPFGGEIGFDSNFAGWSPGVSDVSFPVQPYVKLNAPSGLTTTREAVGDDKVKVTFSWSEPANIGAKTSVTYNLALKNKTTGKWLYSPKAIIGGEKDGWRQVNRLGNVFLNKSWTLTLPKDNYEWTVQAIDAARFGGSFAQTQQLDLNENAIEKLILNELKVSGLNGKLIVENVAGESLNLKVYTASGVMILDKQFDGYFSAPLNKGVYLVKVNGKQGAKTAKVIVK